MKYFALFLLIAIIAFFFIKMQHRMIYFPRPYDRNSLNPKNIIELRFRTSQGSQTAFYHGPPENPGSLPDRLWFLFGGNASLALDWYDFVSRYPDKQAGFMLIDYPGYGKCEGSASPTSILESSEAALIALADQLHGQPDLLEERLHLLGHSLGAAAALQFAGRHPVKKVVLISPFTSLKDMAKIVVGRFFAQAVLHNFDNRARLAELASRSTTPSVYIFHGDADEVVPVAMGRELARLYPDLVNYREIANTDHNFIITVAEQEIYAVMTSDN